jgi:YD repeat-containing protein
MESLHSGAGKGYIHRLGLSKRSWRGQQLLLWAIWLLVSFVLCAGGAQAQSTSYDYDANGRVVAVTANNGTSVQYGYNSLGHATQISAPLPSGQLAIFAFTPTHGVAGAEITLQGQGFSSTAANDTVSFNGAAATVLSASANQLVVAVPSGATTGPISVSVGGQTAASAMPFVIDDTGVPPTITQVGPAIVSIGNTVAVTGTHLAPVVGDTAVQMGGSDIFGLTEVSDSQLQYVVPGNAVTGYVTVDTPYGSAISSAPVIVLPSGISASSVVSSGNAAVGGSAVNLNIGASGQYGAVSFTAPQSGWVSLQASGIVTSASSINYTVYAPNDSVVQQGTISSLSPSIHLPYLVAGATYSVLIQPSGSGVQMALVLEANVSLTTSTPATVVTTVSGQSERLIVQATAGQPLTIFAGNTLTSPAGQPISYTVYNAAQQSVASGSISTMGTINLPVVAATGAYQVIVAPGSGVTGTVQLSLMLGNVLETNGQTSAQSGLAAGQNYSMTFTANAGDNLELTISSIGIIGNWTSAATVNVLDPNGTNVASGKCYATQANANQATCRLPLWNLIQGTYTVVVSPPDSSTSISFSTTLQSDTTGPALSLNTASTVTLGAGQVERLSFTANAGDNLALTAANVSTSSPSGLPVTLAVYTPNGTILTTNAYQTETFTAAGTFDLTNLPTSGTYTLLVFTNGEPGTAQLTLSQETIAANGQTSTYSGYEAGQNAGINFTANAGDNLELTISNIGIIGNWTSAVMVNVLDPNGTNVASGKCYATQANANQATCRLPLWNLIQGTYTVVVSPPDSSTSISFSATLQADTMGPALSLNTASTVTLGAGQVERLSFSANAGDNLALAVANVSTTSPSGLPVTLAVYQPNGSILTTNAYLTETFTSGGTFDLTNLPASGTYTVLVFTNGEPGTAQLTLSQETITANGQTNAYSGYEAGQNAGINFTANAGDNLELTISNIGIIGSWTSAVTVNVLDPNGTNVASGKCYATQANANQATCRLPLWNLIQGTYAIVISPPDSGTAISFSATLQADTVGSALSLNTASTVSLEAGQVERLSFTANTGDNLVLAVANVSTTSPSGLPVTVAVYQPNGTILTTNAYQTETFTSGGAFDLPNLPASGTYTVLVSTNGEPGTAQLTLSQETIAANGETSTYSGYEAGQSAGINFTANAGDNLELTISNIGIIGSWTSAVPVNVFDPNGTNIASGNCYATQANANQATCRLPLWNLIQGTYTVVVSPPDSGTSIGFSAELQADTTGPALSLNTASTVTLGAGQVERMNFTANAGDNLGLAVANVSTTNPTGQSVTFAVYTPGSSITPSGAYLNGQYTSSGTLALTNLPTSGTYTVVVSTSGMPGTAQVTLVQTDSSGNPVTQ